MNLYRKWTLYRYKKIGLIYGDMLSYWFMGKAVGFDSVEKKFKKLERKVEEFGLKPVPVEDFIRAGGYGKPLPDIEAM